MQAQETAPLTGGSSLVKNASVEIRLGFIRKVYSLLSAQLLLTVAIAAPICTLGPVWAEANQWMLVISTVVLLATMCSMMCCQKQLRSFPTNYIFLFIMTCAMSVLVGFTSAMYTWQSVVLAAGITTGIFLAMTIYAWNTTSDFTGFGPYLVGCLFALIFFGFALSIMAMCGVMVQWAMMLYDICGILLFTCYIVYDTQLILGEYGGHKNSFSIDDYVFASLNLYLDIINLFLHILRLLGDRR
eukprot:TRINITY_DN67022_c0_g1_i1.p1 TRINITY_DN67022_c0_g1~~TRINITY_DN67022_c0_g1_i1.p1  ORF type:complete len:243 (+),score=33.86 TRINITY_DN67022_c0_g1_i1:69-797(+)